MVVGVISVWWMAVLLIAAVIEWAFAHGLEKGSVLADVASFVGFVLSLITPGAWWLGMRAAVARLRRGDG